MSARVLVIGVGGLGCPALYVLAPELGEEAQLTLIDSDRVDVSNLHRQILYRTSDAGAAKVRAAAEALGRLGCAAMMAVHERRVDASNVDGLIRGQDVVLDCTDSFAMKFLLNDRCVAAGVPLVHGAVIGWGGQLLSVVPGSACYRCLFEAPPTVEGERCQEAGVIGPVAGVVGALMAAEALAILNGQPRLAGAIETYDGKRDRLRSISFNPRSGCLACGASASEAREYVQS